MFLSLQAWLCRKRLAELQVLFTDVDGVMTDGSLLYGAQGEELKPFHVRDGAGIKMLQAINIHVVMISGRDSPALNARAKDLAIHGSHFGVADKRDACTRAMGVLGIQSRYCAFVGDDSIDLPAFEACGLAVTVADAPRYIRKRADLVLSKTGGNGAIRELTDLILEAKGCASIYGTHDGYLNKLNKMGQ